METKVDGVGPLVKATVATAVVAVGWLKAMELARDRGLVSATSCRKWIHVGTGPLFMLCWFLFPEVPQARYWAAVVPGLITVRFALLGLGLIKDEKTVRSMSRTGDRRELLKGPLVYGIIFVLCTCVYWGNSPVGLSILLILCAGDGFADLVGRKYGRTRLPHSRTKSWAGSIAFFVMSVLFQCAYIHLFHSKNWFAVSLPQYLPTILITTALATVVESLPVDDWDNLTVSLTAWAAHSLLGS